MVREKYKGHRGGIPHSFLTLMMRLIQEKAELLDRFTNYFDKIRSKTREVDRSALDTTVLRPNIVFLDKKPEFKKVLDAIMQQTKVKSLECVAYLQKSKNMARCNSLR